jgi:BA14K-like protein
MLTLKILAAAAVLLVVTPVVAQEMGGGPIGPGSDRGLEPSYNNGYYYPTYYNGYHDGGYRRDEFWPGRAAGDAIGGAVRTAGAIPTAPFRALEGDNSYAFARRAEDGYCAQRYRSYDSASRTYVGYDGRRRICR